METLSLKKTGRMVNVLGVTDVQKYFGKGIFSFEDVEKLMQKSFSKEAVEKAKKDKGFLVAIPRMSVMDIENTKPEIFTFEHNYFKYHRNGSFAKRREEPVWRFIRNEPLPGGCNYSQHKSMLLPDEYIPDARTVIYTAVVLYLKRNIRLFSTRFIRTADACENQTKRVVVKFDRYGRISFMCWNDSIAVSALGCAVAEKIDF